MSIITSEYLKSTGYKCLFKCVKQKGIEPVFQLVQDIKEIASREIYEIPRELIKRNRND